jgi:hypothetical protein
VVAVFLSVVAASAAGPPTQSHKLSSGKVIRVIAVGQMNFSQGSPALALSYQTDLKIDQTDKLRAEVIDIWRDFQKDVDRAKLSNAVIMANEVPSGGLIQKNKSFNFVFVRKADGTWPQEPPR